MPIYSEPVVVRRLASDVTHVVREPGRIGRLTQFGKPYWTTDDVQAACGVKIPFGSAIMRAGTTTKCSACVHITGLTEQSPAVFETLGDPR